MKRDAFLLILLNWAAAVSIYGHDINIDIHIKINIDINIDINGNTHTNNLCGFNEREKATEL